MIITGKSVKNVERYISEFKEDEFLYIGIRGVEDYSNELSLYGISDKLEEGEIFLPRPIKSITKYNANGKIIVDKSAKEERVFERSYHAIDWHGNHHYGTCYQSRMCYRRKFIKPVEVELTYSNGFLLSPLFKNTEYNKDIIKHTVNMFLEIFGECETLTENFVPKTVKRVKKLQWTVLPKGEYLWNNKNNLDVEKLLSERTKKSKKVIINRHKIIVSKNPDFIAVGDQGFYGYLVYGFTQKDIYIFESNQQDNATYVFKGEWEQASKLSKAEIVNGNLCEKRIIHDKQWESSIEDLLR